MTSLILRTATRYMFPLLLIFSVYLLLRGHHYPGGGFVGGLSAGAAFALYALAFDVVSARRLLRLEPRTVTALGLALALISGLLGVFGGHAFLTGVWKEVASGTPFQADAGSPLLFDSGVYLVVLGVILTLVFNLGEEQ